MKAYVTKYSSVFSIYQETYLTYYHAESIYLVPNPERDDIHVPQFPGLTGQTLPPTAALLYCGFTFGHPVIGCKTYTCIITDVPIVVPVI